MARRDTSGGGLPVAVVEDGRRRRARANISTMSSALLLELYFIYDADGTVAGEVAYYLKKWLLGGKCAACDISHVPQGEKPEFALWKANFPVSVLNLHRDELDCALEPHVKEYPCVMLKVQRKIGDLSTVEYICGMNRKQLEGCGSSVENFKQALSMRLDELRVQLPLSRRKRIASEMEINACAPRDVDELVGVPSVEPMFVQGQNEDIEARKRTKKVEVRSNELPDAVVPEL
eukprot:CAMPEP_0198327642 /NCGR_PEP_ID=MMETSP1450-20131203/14857_1 /TAXON_ID=753684 ORGANISM="Madagascaria erythrocladiodes, Strain CCMP3234" /NCGR_SAMPLE_ID=MMETSP1450 /ASSEMBLY_ACC=CAM_ASM_001115 /LENGTH=232 /DNA_ID=CAMNT_0044031699 /DNA_START=66 /DNA_END=764 /DNA_ORIENTATION=+